MPVVNEAADSVVYRAGVVCQHRVGLHALDHAVHLYDGHGAVGGQLLIFLGGEVLRDVQQPVNTII